MAPLGCFAQAPQDSILDEGNHMTRRERVRHRVDSVLDERDSRSHAKVDTNYLQRIPQKLKIKLTFNQSGSAIRVVGKVDGERHKVKLDASSKQTLSIAASYRGMSASVAINPAHLSGKNKDYEFNMNAYGNQVGADVIFQSANTYKGDLTTGGVTSSVPAGLVKQNMLTVNGYYVFNHRKFSYPAAFSQSWIQRRSSGSLMLGATFMGGYTYVTANDDLGTPSSKQSLASLSIGCGYGYNFVIAQKWLLHLSAVPELSLLNFGHITTDGQRERMKYRLFNLVNVGRIAVVRHFQKSFIGLSTVVNYSNIGDEDEMEYKNLKWRARLFYGIKL